MIDGSFVLGVRGEFFFEICGGLEYGYGDRFGESGFGWLYCEFGKGGGECEEWF